MDLTTEDALDEGSVMATGERDGRRIMARHNFSATVALCFAAILSVSGCGRANPAPSSSQGNSAATSAPASATRQVGPRGSEINVSADVCTAFTQAEAEAVIGKLDHPLVTDSGFCGWLADSYGLVLYVTPTSKVVDNFMRTHYPSDSLGTSPCPGYDGFTVAAESRALVVCTVGTSTIILYLQDRGKPTIFGQLPQAAALMQTALERLIT